MAIGGSHRVMERDRIAGKLRLLSKSIFKLQQQEGFWFFCRFLFFLGRDLVLLFSLLDCRGSSSSAEAAVS